MSPAGLSRPQGEEMTGWTLEPNGMLAPDNSYSCQDMLQENFYVCCITATLQQLTKNVKAKKSGMPLLLLQLWAF